MSDKNELRFDGRVAVVTGAGRGLGRGYALFLASRGAKVVVNDVGAARSGDGIDAGPAQEVVDEIRAAGGEAIANTDTVATEEGGQAIIDTAIDTWGRLDILVQNAGNSRRGSLIDMSFDDFDAIVKVHLYGAFNVIRPAFKVMAKAGYGRIVMTGSNSALYGTRNIVGYASCKAAAISMCNTVATEGQEFGIKANCILPGGRTRLAEGRDTSHFPQSMEPEEVAPIVGYLAHESCSISGEAIISMANRVARPYWVETPGVFREHWTPETVAQDIDTICNAPVEDLWVYDTFKGFEAHIIDSIKLNNK